MQPTNTVILAGILFFALAISAHGYRAQDNRTLQSFGDQFVVMPGNPFAGNEKKRQFIIEQGDFQAVETRDDCWIKSATNPNGRVLNISRIHRGETMILLEALGPGRVTITLVDSMDRVEQIDVIVIETFLK